MEASALWHAGAHCASALPLYLQLRARCDGWCSVCPNHRAPWCPRSGILLVYMFMLMTSVGVIDPDKMH